MSVNKYDSTSGTLTSIAAGSRTWIGTRAAYDAEKQAGTLPTNCIIVITDDETDMDTVPTEGSPVAVTSDGIYKAIKKIKMTGTLSIPSGSALDMELDFSNTGVNFYETSCLLDLRLNHWSPTHDWWSSWGVYANPFKIIYTSATTLRILIDNATTAAPYNGIPYEVIVQV